MKTTTIKTQGRLHASTKQVPARNTLKKATAAVCAAALAGCMVPACAFAQPGNTEVDYGTAEKTQVVYVKTAGNGATEGVYVVNQFEASRDTEIRDAGTYEAVVNLTDDQALDAQGGSSFKVTADEPYLYQGNLDAATQLPWNIELGYKLDGKKVDASQLAGASGELEMTLAVEPNDDCKGNYADNYLLQVTGSLDNSLASGIKAPDATLAQAQGSTQLSYMVFPGKSASYSIKAQVRDFEFDGWQIAGVPLAIALDIDDSDLSGSSKDLDKLEDATKQLDEGAASLKDGSVELADAMRKLTHGSKTLSESLVSAAQAGDKLNDGAAQLRDGVESQASTLSGEAADVDTSAAQSSYAQAAQSYTLAFAGAFSKSYASTYQALVASGISEQEASAQAQAKAAQAASQSCEAEYAALQNALEALVTAQATKSGYASAATALNGVLESYGQLEQSVGEYTGVVSKLADGATTLSDGTSSVSDGAAGLSSGSSTLAEGAAELADETDGIGDKLTDEVREKLTDYLNPSFTLRDFVNESSKGIENVQFVYMTPEIEVPDEEEEESTAEDDRGFVQKFLALFGL